MMNEGSPVTQGKSEGWCLGLVRGERAQVPSKEEIA